MIEDVGEDRTTLILADPIGFASVRFGEGYDQYQSRNRKIAKN
jgi:hypothetical protein